MKAEELRIGNIVFADAMSELLNEPMVIGGISYEVFLGECAYVSSKYNEGGSNLLHRHPICIMRPIPVTEDILLKCGFKVVHPEYKDIYAIRNIEYLVGCGDKSGMHWNGYQLPKTKYLHQLQNAYYAITGEELQVKI